MEESRKNQSHVCGQSYVNPERTTTAKVSAKSVLMIEIRNRVNYVTLYLLKGKLINRVVFGGQDKLLHTPHQSSSETL